MNKNAKWDKEFKKAKALIAGGMARPHAFKEAGIPISSFYLYLKKEKPADAPAEPQIFTIPKRLRLKKSEGAMSQSQIENLTKLLVEASKWM